MDLQEKQVIEEARAVVVKKMDSDTVPHVLLDFLGTLLYIITDMYDYFIFIFVGYNVTISSRIIKHTPIIIATI
jgi:hypothetical protein